jgi:hypothetical protein
LPRIKSLHFYSLRTPIEAIRALSDAPGASGIEEIVFETASRPGMPEVLAGLLRSPLGRRLKRLTLRTGPEATDDLVRAFVEADTEVRLEALTLATVALDELSLDHLLRSGPLRQLAEIHLTAVPSGAQAVAHFAASAAGNALAVLRVNRSDVGSREFARVAGSSFLTGLRALDLSEQALPSESELIDRLARSEDFAGLRAVALRKCMLGDASIGLISRARFWPNLVELDLRENRVTDTGAESLLAAPVPADLTGLLLDGNRISAGMAARLREKYGEAVFLGPG